jgi:SAM-dependent methyltransferase
MSDRPLSRRALFTLGLSRLGAAAARTDPPLTPRPSAPAPLDLNLWAYEQADLHALSTEPASVVAALAKPADGEDVLVVRGGGLEDDFADHRGLLAVIEPAELESLPFDEASVDRALAPLAPFFSPNPRVALAELARVVRPGGTVAVAAWTRLGAIGSLLATIPGWDPDADPRLEWGDADHLRGELAAYAEGVAVSAHEVHVDAVDAQAAAALAERALPPMAAALAGYPGADANGLRAHAARLLGDAPDGRFLVAVAMLRRS